jgi:hypothetical protein
MRQLVGLRQVNRDGTTARFAATAIEDWRAAKIDVIFADPGGVERCEPLSVCWSVRFERARPVRACAMRSRFGRETRANAVRLVQEIRLA